MTVIKLSAVIGLMFVGSLAASIARADTSDSATYQYYPNGRLWTVTYANGTVITYTYDAAGNRTSVVTSCSANGC